MTNGGDDVKNTFESIRGLQAEIKTTKERIQSERENFKQELATLLLSNPPEKAHDLIDEIYFHSIVYDVPITKDITSVWKSVYHDSFVPPEGEMHFSCRVCGGRITRKIATKTDYIYYKNIEPNSRDLICANCKEQEDRKHELIKKAREEQQLERLHELKTMPYSEYLETPEWDSTRKMALKRARYRCQLCNNNGKLNVHHRTYENRGEEDAKDLIVLCKNCHTKFHNIEA